MTLLLRSAIAIAAGLFGQSPVFSIDPDQPVIEGRQAIVAIERDGKPFDEAVSKGATLRFSGNKIVGANADGSEFLTGEFTLNAIRQPCTIVVKLTAGPSSGTELRGMIDRRGNTIRLILANAGADRPTEFRTKLNQTMFTLKAEK